MREEEGFNFPFDDKLLGCFDSFLIFARPFFEF